MSRVNYNSMSDAELKQIDRVIEDKNYYIDLITNNNSNDVSSMENKKKGNKSKEQYLQPELPF